MLPVSVLSPTAVSLLGASVGVIVTVILWAADRYDFAWALRHGREQRLTGRWHGWSVYIPIDGFYSRDSEAIYRTVVDFKQRGRRITFDETLTEIYNIDGSPLWHLGQRQFRGSGAMGGSFDLSARFSETDGLTVGSMHLVADTRAHELIGILAVRPKIPGRPVAVKILLRRVGQQMPTWDDLGVPLLQEIARAQAKRARLDHRLNRPT